MATATGLSVLSDTSLTAVAPPGAGTVNVTVTRQRSEPASGRDQYTYGTTKSMTTVGGGYDMVGSDGGVFVPFGDAGFSARCPASGCT